MTIKRTLFNGTDGTDLTTTNVTPNLNVVAKGTNDTLKFSAAFAKDGATGIQGISGASSTGCLVRQTYAASASTTASESFWYYLPSSPTATAGWLNLFSKRTSAPVMKLYWDGLGSGVSGGGRVVLGDQAGTFYYPLGSTSAQIAAGWYRFELQSTNALSTAQHKLQMYNTAGTQVVNWDSGAALAGSTAAYQSVDLGMVNGVAGVTWAADTLQMNDGSTTPIGSYAPNTTPPTLTVGSNQTVAQGATVNLSASQTPVAPSTAGTFTWTCTSFPIGGTTPTLTNPTSGTPSFTAASYGRYVFSVTATDSDGNTSAAQQVKIFVPGTAVQVIETTTAGAWSGTSNAASYLGDTNDATYVESSAPTGTPNYVVLRLAPMLVPTTFADVVRLALSTGSGTAYVKLYEGGTLRKDWGTLTSALSTTPTDFNFSLTSAEIAAIGSWNELDLWVGWST